MNNLFSNIFKKREKVIIPLQEEIENLEFLLFLSPLLANAVSLIVMVISGLIANKCYYNHSVKKIKNIKSTTNKELLNETLETKGGVNLPIAVSVAFAFLVVNYLPMFLM